RLLPDERTGRLYRERDVRRLLEQSESSPLWLPGDVQLRRNLRHGRYSNGHTDRDSHGNADHYGNADGHTDRDARGRTSAVAWTARPRVARRSPRRGRLPRSSSPAPPRVLLTGILASRARRSGDLQVAMASGARPMRAWAQLRSAMAT